MGRLGAWRVVGEAVAAHGRSAERDASEVTDLTGRTASGEIATIRVAPMGSPAANPAFDVTPGHLVTALVTEYGILRPPYLESIPDLDLRPRFVLSD